MNKLLTAFAALLLSAGATAQLDTDALERAMANPDRPAADKERDTSRRAPEVLEFMGLEEGMTVLDLVAIGGWYTEVLSYAVGDSGHVYMQNTPGPFVDRNEALIEDRLERLDNVEHWLRPIDDLPDGSIDFALTALNFHDIYNANPANAQGFLAQVHGALRPGGILAVIDHEGTPGMDNTALHRIAFADAVNTIVNAGFALVGTSELLDNPDDDHTVGPFDPSLERNTDRFVLKFVKQ